MLPLGSKHLLYNIYSFVSEITQINSYSYRGQEQSTKARNEQTLCQQKMNSARCKNFYSTGNGHLSKKKKEVTRITVNRSFCPSFYMYSVTA